MQFSGKRHDRRDVGRIALAMAAAAGFGASPAAAGGNDGGDGGGGDGDAVFGPGDHTIERDRTISGTLILRPGARLSLRAGVTLTLLGDLVAPARTVFLGPGTVDLTRSRLLAARPEWWGAAADEPAVDNAPPIEMALAAHIAVQLGPGDYHLHRTLALERANRRLWGIGRTNGAHGTRLLKKGGNGAVVRVGTEAAPPTINAYLRGIDLRWLELGRTEAPIADGRATGLDVRHVLDGIFHGLRANEHAIGFSFRGAVRTLVEDCAAFRSLFAGRPTDTFVGFDLDGTRPPIATGANASLYLIDCTARTGNRPLLAGAIGCRMLGAFSDTFLVRFETTELGYGILVDGGAAGAPTRYAQVDLHLDTPVLDQCGRAGIVLRRLGDTAMVDVVQPWVAVAAGADAAIQISDTGGAVGVMGGQLVAVGPDPSTGVLLERTTGVTLAAVKLLDLSRPLVVRQSAGFDLSPVILAGRRLGGTAVQLSACSAGMVRPRLLGRAGQFATGVGLDDACRSLLVETVGLPAADTAVRIGANPARSVAGMVAVA